MFLLRHYSRLDNPGKMAFGGKILATRYTKSTKVRDCDKEGVSE